MTVPLEHDPVSEASHHRVQTLHRHLGRPADTWTVDDILAFVRDRNIRLLSLMHVGGDGWLKTLDFVPATRHTSAMCCAAASAPTAPACSAISASRSGLGHHAASEAVDGVRRSVRG